MSGSARLRGGGGARRFAIFCTVIGAVSVAAPFVFPSVVTQLSIFWVMVIVAYTWDTMGGQLGYNSFGNIVFFGVGLYLSAIIQIAPFTDMRDYTAAGEQGKALALTMAQYFGGLAPGLVAAAPDCDGAWIRKISWPPRWLGSRWRSSSAS